MPVCALDYGACLAERVRHGENGLLFSNAQQLAEVLGISVEDINPSVGDTDSVGFTSNTGGSGVTFKTGWSTYEAAQDVKRQMCGRAARTWECPVEEVEYREGAVCHKKDADKQLTFKQIAARQNATGGPITGRAGVNPAGRRGRGQAGGSRSVDCHPYRGRRGGP